MSKHPERRLRFTIEQDMQLLKEVIRENPFEDVERWKNVHENFVNECNVPFSLRTCKDHCNHLLNQYLKDSLKPRPKETPDVFAKKQKYLDQIHEMRKQYGSTNTPRRGPRSTSTWEDDGANTENVKKEHNDSRTEDSDDDFFWDEENERDKKEKEREANNIEAKLRQRELAIEERKVALKELQVKLEAEKLELDKMELFRRMEIERSEREMYKKVMMQNQVIINSLMDRYNKRNGGSNLCIL